MREFGVLSQSPRRGALVLSPARPIG